MLEALEAGASDAGNERCCRREGVVADGVVAAGIGRGVVNRRVRRRWWWWSKERDVNARRVNVSASDGNVYNGRMLARRGRATGYKAGNGNGSVSRAASNQQFARTSRRCDRPGSRGPFGREIARCQTVPVFGPSCDGFRTAQGVVLDWPVVWGEIKMAARQPVACRTPLAIPPTRASSCRWAC